MYIFLYLYRDRLGTAGFASVDMDGWEMNGRNGVKVTGI